MHRLSRKETKKGGMEDEGIGKERDESIEQHSPSSLPWGQIKIESDAWQTQLSKVGGHGDHQSHQQLAKDRPVGG
jgi:hypothetical protein